MNRGLLIPLTLFMALVLLARPSIVALGEDWLPTESSFLAWGKAIDCKIYRSIASRSKREQEVFQQEISELTVVVQSRYEALYECLRGKGQRRLRDEVNMAELCPEEYRQWIAPGYRLRLLQQEVEEVLRSIEGIKDMILLHCGKGLKIMSPIEGSTGSLWPIDQD